MATLNFKFEEAPKTDRNGGGRTPDPREFEIAQQLRDNPGREARVFEFDKPKTATLTAQTIRKAERAAFRDGGFTARSRTIDGKGVVFVTYHTA